MLLLPGSLLSQNRAQSKNNWNLVWQDEFNGTQLDTNKWNVLIREHSKHNELQYYVPDEVYVENGMLVIRSRIRKYGSKDYTSGRLDTKGKFAPAYGRFEIRAKLPDGKGLWPAHWLYPQDRDTAIGGSWPGNPDSTTTFPQYHYIDYVRIFQKKPYF